MISAAIERVLERPTDRPAQLALLDSGSPLAATRSEAEGQEPELIHICRFRPSGETYGAR
jgi:hypothetical protein